MLSRKSGLFMVIMLVIFTAAMFTGCSKQTPTEEGSIVSVSAGGGFTVALKSNGTLIAVGNNEKNRSNVSKVLNKSKDIAAIYTGDYTTVGLKADGSVVATGEFSKDIEEWNGISDIAVNAFGVIGVKTDGTVIFSNSTGFGFTEDDNWEDVVDAAVMSMDAAFGLKKDGTLLATGKYKSEAGSFADLVAISSGDKYCIGLKKDGRVVVIASDDRYPNDVDNWRDIVSISVGRGQFSDHIVALKNDGTVVASGHNGYGECDVSGWSEIIAISAGQDHTVGLKKDGSVVATGNNEYGQCDVEQWKSTSTGTEDDEIDSGTTNNNENTNNQSGSNTAINKTGNIPGNIINQGWAAIQGEWIYYHSKNGLMKIRTDNSEKVLIVEDDAKSINVIGDWIYYAEGSDRYNIYKVKTDGSSRTKLTDESLARNSYLSVAGDWIYYCSPEGYVCRMRTDGTEKTVVINEKASYLNVEDNWIYYSDGKTGYIYKIKVDGTGKLKINNEKSLFLNVADGWIYYCNQSDEGKIYKIGIDGNGRTKLTDSRNVFIFNTADDQIYYTNGSSKDILYRINADGTNLVIIDDSANYADINIAGDWIYYSNPENGSLYRIRKDGTTEGVNIRV